MRESTLVLTGWIFLKVVEVYQFVFKHNCFTVLPYGINKLIIKICIYFVVLGLLIKVSLRAQIDNIATYRLNRPRGLLRENTVH